MSHLFNKQVFGGHLGPGITRGTGCSYAIGSAAAPRWSHTNNTIREDGACGKRTGRSQEKKQSKMHEKERT